MRVQESIPAAKKEITIPVAKKEDIFSLTILLIGETKVGKSALYNRFYSNVFNESFLPSNDFRKSR